MAKKRIIDDSGEEMRFQVMMQALLLGITPEDLKEFYDIVKNSTGNDMGGLFEGPAEEPARGPAFPPMSARNHDQTHSEELKDAAEKTLKLRVQMRDVSKPPMWRELKVPADFTFFQLHKAIQAVCGFEDAHLWQFQHRPYDPDLQIGVPADRKNSFGMGLEEWTHDARKTGITAFLAEKGQKLVYVYDFGDDWIFNVSVVDVTPRDGEVAECIRWKSDLQPMEDCGGVWSYLDMRSAWEQRDSLTKRQKNELADSQGFESFDELMDVVSDYLFDPEAVNERLAEI